MEYITLTLPKAPPPELLVSMAMRIRHDFALDKINSISAGMTPEEREVLTKDMIRLYEEMTNQGFYKWGGDNSYYTSPK